MPELSENVSADAVEPLPIGYGDVFICFQSENPYPLYRADTRELYNYQTREYLLTTRLVENFVIFVDNNGDEQQVHPSNADEDCEWCGNATLRDEELSRARMFRRSHGTHLCNGCAEDAVQCDRCAAATSEDYTYNVRDEYWCESCYDNYTEHCDACDETFPAGEECGCDDSRGLIQPYSTKFSPLFLHDYNYDTDDLVLVRNYVRDPQFAQKIAMGLEFEMENMGAHYTSEVASIFTDAYEDDHLMLKQDGSINNGFELVTQPHTLDAFMKVFDWDLIRKAQQMGMRGWDVGSREIGIHIHINRKAFHSKADHTRYNASPHLMAFMYFIYSNVKPITRIAGRNVHYGHMSKRYLEEAFMCARRGMNQQSRTYAVNLLNDATVELRMFRSTMRVERVQAYLQFAEAAVRYTSNDRINKMRDRFHFADFAEWVSFQPRYEQLHNLIVETDAVAHAPAKQVVPTSIFDEPESTRNEYMPSILDASF